MHLHNALSVAKNSDTEWFHNITTNVLQVFLVDASVLPTHVISQLKPNLLLEVKVIIKYQVGISVISNSVFIQPSPEVTHG